MLTNRINFLDVQFDRLDFNDVKAWLRSATSETPYAFVVTPNVDHLVRIEREPELRSLYESADLCVCDSRILKLLARLRSIKLPLVPGSDLCAALFKDVIADGDRIAIIGSDQRCVEQLKTRFPLTDIRHFEPPMGLRSNPDARRMAADFIASSRARFNFIAVGSPQQEMIAKAVRDIGGAGGIGLCIGAGLDFIVGKQQRAPELLQRMGLEWAHRLGTNPRRLWRRYLVEDIRILPIWLRWRAPGRRRGNIGAYLVFSLLLVIGGLVVSSVIGQRKQSARQFTSKLPALSRASIATINALPAPNLVKPLSAEQAVTENGERPFVARPDTSARQFVLHTDSDDRARALTCLAQAVYYEAAGEGVDGERAVAQVVLNRVRHPGFPSTICGVVYEGSDRPTGCQFSFTCNGSMAHVPVPSLWTRSRQVADQALKGRVYSAIGHATHYHADYVLPYWADSLDKSVQVGKHIFYRLRAVLGEARSFSQHYGGTEPPFREPGTTIVMAQDVETEQQLANALTTDSPQSSVSELPNAAPRPSSPLIVDSAQHALLADGGNSPAIAKPAKQNLGCSAASDSKQVSALRADDMRASASFNC